MIDYRLYFVTGNYGYEESHFLRRVEEACQSGVTLVQLREKVGTTREIYERALKVKKITDRYSIPLIINDRVDICLAIDAAGVHIGDEELPVSIVRQMVGKQKIVGVSSKSVKQSIQAQKDGADYLGVGAMFPTKTKSTSLTTFETLQEIVKNLSIPIIAIGGIKRENLMVFKESGIAGVAVVSEIMEAQNVKEKVCELKKILMNGLERG